MRASIISIAGGLVTIVHREPIILADRNNVPTVLSEDARDGGLLSYGVDLVFRRAATYVNRVLHGAKPRTFVTVQNS
jgi:hypothetical protein